MESIIEHRNDIYNIDDLTFGTNVLSFKKYNTNIPWNYNPINENKISKQPTIKYQDDGYDSDYAHWRE